MKPMKNDNTLDQLLKEMAADHRPQLPSPGFLWWRAKLHRKQKEKERIERPLIVMQQVAAVASGAVFVALLADDFGRMQTVIRNNSWFLMPLLILAVAAALVSTALPLWSRAKR
jgi:hypothetical protein